MTDVVYLMEEGVLAEVITWGAHASLLSYRYMGTDFKVWTDNEDFITVEESND